MAIQIQGTAGRTQLCGLKRGRHKRDKRERAHFATIGIKPSNENIVAKVGGREKNGPL
jgi:hypothetical protein